MKKSNKVIIISLLLLSTLLLEITGISTSFGTSYAYTIKPLIWLFLGVITFIFFKNSVYVNNKYKKDINFIVLTTTLAYFFIYFFIGYIKGFAHNPYDTSIKGILTNLWMFVPMLVVREYLRYYMINNCEQKHILWWTLFISIVFVCLEVNIYKFDTYFSDTSSAVKFIMETFSPALVTNLYLTYVCYFAGYETSIIYALIPQMALYVLPILPDIDWATLGVLNTAVPFFSYIYISNIINKMDKTANRKKYNKKADIGGWILMIATVILMICFGMGMFPYQPLVIASNSMAPKIHKGDIVIIKDTDVKDVKEGEVIRYKLDNYYVIHRVKEIKTDFDGTRTFITKGDNNNDIDLYPVKESQFKGSVKYQVPYLGWPTLIINEALNTHVGEDVKVDKGKTN